MLRLQLFIVRKMSPSIDFKDTRRADGTQASGVFEMQN